MYSLCFFLYSKISVICSFTVNVEIQIIFKSAVESTNCAIEIQTTLHERNKKEEAGRRILLRIGLHIGDVVYVDQQVHGDGVNIAARLEGISAPGAICLSEDAYR